MIDVRSRLRASTAIRWIRSLAAAKLDSKTSRLKLEPQRKPYYYALDEGYHLGYRRLKDVPGSTANAGRWVIPPVCRRQRL